MHEHDATVAVLLIAGMQVPLLVCKIREDALGRDEFFDGLGGGTAVISCLADEVRGAAAVLIALEIVARAPKMLIG